MPANTACTPLRQAQGGLVGLPLRGVRVFEQFAWLEAGSGKAVSPRPAHQRVTLAVRRLAKSIGRPDLYVIESNKP